MTELKNIYNEAFFEQFTKAIQKVKPDFNKQNFYDHIYDSDWNVMELKQRMKHIAAVLHEFLHHHFEQDVQTIYQIIHKLRETGIKNQRLEYMFIPEYIERYGLNHLQTSLNAFEVITSFTSCEFAIRPFIIKYPNEVIVQMLEWSKHPDQNVRRFASEGCRPRLPWAMALSDYKKDPAPIIPILEHLKEDPSEYVRRSVANNLNDIAKDHSALVLHLAEEWMGKSKETDWIIKHGCRTLLKKGHPEALKLFGLQEPVSCEIRQLQIRDKKIRIGDTLQFSFHLQHHERENIKLRIEYAIYYMKSNGKQNKKIFKLSEKIVDTNVIHSFKRKQSFRDMTTRKHYLGQHKLAIIVNGKQLAIDEFEIEE
jgi:3-methyladenine DNA glycosylase AlkC